MKKWLIKSTLMLATVFLFSNSSVSSVAAVKLPEKYVNHKKEKRGGTLRVGYATNTPFKGVFATYLSVDGPTEDMSQFGEPGLFRKNDDYTYAKGGLATVEFDYDKKTATVKFKKDAGWSDGHPLEAKDMEYTYEVIANSKSNSGDYGEVVREVEGIEQYHDGKADKISGLEVKNQKTLVIHFKQMKPEMKFPGAGYVLNTVMPYHYLKDVPFDQLVQNDKVRKHPLFYGPFKIKHMVQGESIEWVPNKYYGGKKPKVAKIDAEIVSENQAGAAMQADKYDVLLNQGPATYKRVKKLTQYVVLGAKAHSYSYVGFKVGHWDNAKSLNVMDRKTPVRDRALRQAMGYALDMDQITKKFGFGLNYRANTLVPDAFDKYNDHKAKGFPYEPKKANRLLDKAGYKMHKDGYRTLPNGKKFTLKLLASGDNNDKTAINVYLDYWKKIGVKVELKDGRLHEFNSYIDQLTKDGKGFDVWLSSWSVTSAPTQSIPDNYLPTDPYNLGHFVEKENTELIRSLYSKKAFNSKYQLKQFYKWQEYMNKEAYIVPRYFSYDTYTFSKKLANVSLNSSDTYNLWEDIAFTK